VKRWVYLFLARLALGSVDFLTIERIHGVNTNNELKLHTDDIAVENLLAKELYE
jgi:hypothetical protein